MQVSNIKGLWMPIEILINENLNDKEKLLYALILFFSKNDGYCSITNKYFGSIVNISDTRVSKLISSLSKKRYVQVIINYQDSSKMMANRIIKPLVKYDNPTYAKMTTGIVDNDQGVNRKATIPIVDNNKNIKYNKYKINNSNEREYNDEFWNKFYANK